MSFHVAELIIMRAQELRKKTEYIIISFGPARIFAALKLSEAGLMPVVYERRDSIEERHRKVVEFWNTESLIHSQMCSSVKAGWSVFRRKAIQ